MKKSIMIVLFCMSLAILVSCERQNKEVEEVAQTVADAFTAGDIATINKTIFGIDELEVDGELIDMWGESNISQEGILEYIFQNVSLKVKRTTGNIIEYEVNAPNMSDVFVNLEADISNITENELLEYITDYAKNAETKTTTVALEYILAGEELIIDYQDEAFINAVTGGLLDAYKELYSEMIKDYMEGVN